MKKALLILAALCLMFFGNSWHGASLTKAEAFGEGLNMTDPLVGIYRKPANTPQASCLFRYSFPQFQDAPEINRFYHQLAQQLDEVFVLDGEGEVQYEITFFSDQYVSIVLNATLEAGQGSSESISAHTFARDGVYQGERLTLSQLLGMEAQVNSGHTLSSELVWELVWRIVETQSLNAESDYFEGLTKDKVQNAFQPEADFYLDADGNIVFYVQPGMLAGEIAGMLRFPFAAEELLSAFESTTSG